MSTPKKQGGQNTGRPLHFKKQGGMSPCTPVHPRIYAHVDSCRVVYTQLQFDNLYVSIILQSQRGAFPSAGNGTVLLVKNLCQQVLTVEKLQGRCVLQKQTCSAWLWIKIHWRKYIAEYCRRIALKTTTVLHSPLQIRQTVVDAMPKKP